MTQKEALDILKTGRNVFLTGPAGSGKTFVLREYIKYLKELNANIGITASTGIAATHMGGTTIHSWSGIGINNSLTSSEISEIAERSHVVKKVKDSSVLIIDEISMLSHNHLDLVDKVVREIKSVDKPFGGMQVVLCGDFFQLPPIHRSGEIEALFAYHGTSWKDMGVKICYLSEQHRQKDDHLIKILNEVRSGSVSSESSEILQTRFIKNKDLDATKLYTHNSNVDTENFTELDKISGKKIEYIMRSSGKKSIIETLKKSCLAPENLELKKGAKVMFVKNNFEKGYVNGTLGVVENCEYEDIRVKTLSGQTIDVEREYWAIEEEGKTIAEISQFPLRLAWAITIHKSQGMSLDAAEIDLSRSFERGMGYVAISRVRSLDGLFLKGINAMALEVNQEVLELDRKFKKMSETNSFHIRTFGEEKVKEMHEEFKTKIENKSSSKKPKLSTVEETKKMLNEGMQIKKIAEKRGLKFGTIIDHIEEIKSENPSYNIYNLKDGIPQTKFKKIYAAFKKLGISEEGFYKLGPVKNLLGPKFSYDDLRLVRLFL